MKLVLLPGNHLKNRDWIYQIEESLKDSFDETYIQCYQHRNSEHQNMDLEYEMEILYEEIKYDKNITIFAKSLWDILAIMAMTEEWINPSKCIFLWFPMWFVKNNEFPLEDYLSQIQCPVLFIQKAYDPACDYQELVDLISAISDKFHFHEIPGNDHEYDDIKEIKNLTLNFINSFDD